MPLTDVAIRRVKPAAKPLKLGDSGGLYLYITTAGSKSWRWKYRFSGKEKLLTLGLYPDVGLAAARGLREDARRLLADGVDPSEQRKAATAAPASFPGDSFEVIAREWLRGRPWVEAHRRKVVAWFENDVFPFIGDRPAGELKASDFLQVARRIEARRAEPGVDVLGFDVEDGPVVAGGGDLRLRVVGDGRTGNVNALNNPCVVLCQRPQAVVD